MKTRSAVFITATLLSACQASPIEPGEWETRVETTQIEIYRLSTTHKGVSVMRLLPTTTKRSCLAFEQASEPSRYFLVGGTRPDNCDRRGLTMKDGQVGGTVTCKLEGEETKYSLSGSYTPTEFDVMTKARVHISSEELLQARPVAEMDVTSRITARRLGDCPQTWN